MNFRKDEIVVHCSYGLGRIIALDERTLFGRTVLYYAVKIDTMTVWVPADENLAARLRVPTHKSGFKQLFKILKSPGEVLPMDRQARKLQLRERLQDGRAESLCFVIRSIEDFHRKHALNDNDQLLLERARHTISSEWGYAMSISPIQADYEIELMLDSGTE